MKKTKIIDIIEIWKKEKRKFIKQSSYSTYVTMINNHIIPYFGKKCCFLENEVQEFILQKLNQGLSVKTIKDIIVILKMILKFSAKQGYMKYVDISVKIPHLNNAKNLNILSSSEYKKLVCYTKNNFTFKNLGVFICLSTGMRIGEICGLKWEDIDTSLGIIKISRTVQRIYLPENKKTVIVESSPKTTSSKREIPITNELLKILKPLKRVVNGNYYVLTNSEKPTEPRSYRNFYKLLIKKLDIGNYKFHFLRHSFASKCIDSNCDYKTLSVILGHSNVNTTLNIYVHPSNEQKKKCIDRMMKNVM